MTTPKTRPAVVARIPTPEEVGRNWPRFRGPGGRGVSAFDNAPAAWDGPSGKNVAWKTPVPLPGFNSPVVWGDRVFLAGADRDRREVFCFHANTGELLWRYKVKTAAPNDGRDVGVWDDTGYAAPTVAADGQRVCAAFATGDLVCLDFEGNPLWRDYFGPLANEYGHSSSLTMWRNLLLVQADQAGGEEGQGASMLIAYDAHRGRREWEARRQVGGSWMSPIVIETDSGPQVIAGGAPLLIAHNLDDGQAIWQAKVLGGDAAPSPVFADGTVFIAQPYGKLSAVGVDGVGDVTTSHVKWQAEEGIPDICSPLTDGKNVWLLTTGGTLTCYNAADGKKVYEQDLELEFNASPSLAGGRLYLTALNGVTLMVSAGRTYKLLGRAALGERVKASPAFADGRIYLRGEKRLYCIRETK